MILPMGSIDSRLLVLAVPSAIVLAILLVHSLRAMPRRRAAAFWGAVLTYGFVRGVAIGWITRSLGARFPYEIHSPLLSVLGVSAQEITGWAIVCYLAWWLGFRFAPRKLFVQAAWGALFLGCVSWTVESAAIAAGWWHWNVPTGSGIFLNVPLIGLIDWFFVGTDFLLPFAVLTAPALKGSKRRYFSLLLLPLHLGSHAFIAPISPHFPIPVFHLVHWLLLTLLVWLAVKNDLADSPFQERDRVTRLLPLIAVGLIVADAFTVLVFVVKLPRLLPTLAPLLATVAVSLWTHYAVAIIALVLIGLMAAQSLAVALVPPMASLTLKFLARHQKALPVALLALWIGAWQIQASSGRHSRELQRRLDLAIAARDRGDLSGAVAELQRMTEEFPDSHVPFALLGEIYYRTGRASEALPLYERAIEIKQSFLPGYEHAAVIELQRGDRARAASVARRGLIIDRGDLELDYLLRLADGQPLGPILEEAQRSPEQAAKIASLAFEVDDRPTSERILDRAIAAWPQRADFYRLRLRVAVAQRNLEEARRVAALWLQRFPSDREALTWSQRLR